MKPTNNNQLQTITVPRSEYAPFVEIEPAVGSYPPRLYGITEAGLNKIITNISNGKIPIFEGFKPEELLWPLGKLCEHLGNTASESRIEQALKIAQLYSKTVAKDIDCYFRVDIYERFSDAQYAIEKRFGEDSNINKLALETADQFYGDGLWPVDTV